MHRPNVTVTAETLKVTLQAMSNLLSGQAGLSADMTIRFEKAFGIRADTLLRMQATHDLADARAHDADIKMDRVAA